MPKQAYQELNLSRKTLAVIDQANKIIAEYSAAGYDLTLRQLYYQFVARALIPNKQKSYKALGEAINSGRLAGMIDWNHITDRTRNLRSVSSWDSPADIINSAAASFKRDLWADQAHRIEVWIEKDALLGVLDVICPKLRVPYFSCRGYVSQSEMWGAAQRLRRHEAAGYKTVMLHLGDHDPSGVDMTRDLEARLLMFKSRVKVERLALNMPQIEALGPPPNPVKTTDSRHFSYIAKYGEESWELDALDPATLTGLIRDRVLELRDDAKWEAARAVEDQGIKELRAVVAKWPRVTKLVAKAAAKINLEKEENV